MVLDAMLRHFPTKTHSLDDFIRLIRERGATSVQGETIRSLEGGLFPSNHKYFGRFTATTRTGRRIIYKKTFYSTSRGQYGFSDLRERNDIALRALHTTDNILRRIKEKVPDIETALTCPEGDVEKGTYQDLCRVLASYKIAPFPVPCKNI
ncbi:MAG: hypothetical protein V1702_03195 [Candidatus Woesearchaeota archaeon]